MPPSCQSPAMEPFDAAVRYARLADELGYEAISLSHIASHDSSIAAAASRW